MVSRYNLQKLYSENYHENQQINKIKGKFQIYKKQNLIMPLLLTSKFVYYVKL